MKKKKIKEKFQEFRSQNLSSANKNIVFRTRDVNSAVNIREITSLWIQEQRRLAVFCRPIKSSFTTSQTLVNGVEKVGPSLPSVVY